MGLIIIPIVRISTDHIQQRYGSHKQYEGTKLLRTICIVLLRTLFLSDI